MMSNLFINFSSTRKFADVDYFLKLKIREAIATTLDFEYFPYDAEVSVTFTDNEYIKVLNKSYRDVDKHTDVLSFPMYENWDIPEDERQNGCCLGDIVISIPRAKEQAMELGNSFIREMCFLTIHSTLHLLGYDHERSALDDEMQCAKQRQIIELINFD